MEGTILTDIIKNIKLIYDLRAGNEVPLAVQQVLDATYEALKPRIKRKFRTGTGWEFHVSLPPGLAYADFKAKEPLFADAVGGVCFIEKRGLLVRMQVSDVELKSMYPYAFQPAAYPDMDLPVPFGYSAMGLIVRDLADFPHLLVAGHPGSGKSAFLHVLTIALLQSGKAHMFIIDLKRLEFVQFKNHVALITNVQTTKNALLALNQELDRRLDELARAGAKKIQDYNNMGGNMQFIVLVIDELAELFEPDCQQLLNRILRLGRAPGFCVVAATQRPSSTMLKSFGDSKAQFAGTMCFHVRDAVNSRMVLDNDNAALIPNIPGRAIFQWDIETPVQSMFISDKIASKILDSIPAKEVIKFEQSSKRLPPR